MSQSATADIRLAVVICSDHADLDFATAVCTALSGRMLLVLSCPPSLQPVRCTGFDYLCNIAGSDMKELTPLLIAAGVTADQTTVLRRRRDLQELQKMLPPAVRYRVRIEAADTVTSGAFLDWVLHEHAPEILALPGCRDYTVCRLTPTELACEYAFTSEAALQAYYSQHADVMRSRYKLKFPAAEIKFSREEATVAGCGFKRHAADYGLHQPERSPCG